MEKNKKILIVAIIAMISIVGIYVSSSVRAMKQYENYSIEDYNILLKDLYERNLAIISDKEVLIKNIPGISNNIENIETLMYKEKKDMNINDGINLSNEIEPNVTTIINEYKKNKELSTNKELNIIMENIMGLDHNCSVSQKIFNKSLNDKDTGFNGSFFNNGINEQLAKMFGFEKINEFKSE